MILHLNIQFVHYGSCIGRIPIDSAFNLARGETIFPQTVGLWDGIMGLNIKRSIGARWTTLMILHLYLRFVLPRHGRWNQLFIRTVWLCHVMMESDIALRIVSF